VLRNPARRLRGSRTSFGDIVVNASFSVASWRARNANGAISAPVLMPVTT
jgi:hypothetical protein